MKILDLGCGKNKIKSKNENDLVIGADSIKLDGVDVVYDLEKFPWPFKDNEFDLIISNHTLEHLSNLVKTMEEIYRVGKPGAIIKVNVPYFAYPGAFQDPTHKRFFTLRTFEYFNEKNGLSYYSRARFEILKKQLNFSITWPKISRFFDMLIKIHPSFYERFFSRILPAENLHVELKIIK